MAAESQTIWLCVNTDRDGCTSWVQYDAALLPASDVPALNQFLVVLGDALYNPTPEAVAYVFAWGAAAVLGFWAIGIATGAALRVLRKL